MKANVIFVLGLIIFVAGGFFALQGAGIIRWPAESFMVGTRHWIEYGIAIAMIGGGLMLAARRIKQG